MITDLILPVSLTKQPPTIIRRLIVSFVALLSLLDYSAAKTAVLPSSLRSKVTLIQFHNVYQITDELRGRSRQG